MGTLLAGIALHGLCFGCFIFVAFMIVDENTSSDVRASAQNLFNLVIIGIGVIVGSLPIPIPGMAAPVKLGLAGGPLIVAILLSRLGNIGPVIWYMPV